MWIARITVKKFGGRGGSNVLCRYLFVILRVWYYFGAALYGWIDHNATSANSALGHAIDEKWRILFVPMFALCLGLINQARWSQVPIMIVIAGIGYIGSFCREAFSTVTEFTACIGAFIVGVLGNLYSRI